ncbi:hypothetical protein SAMN04488085_103259 [Geodermatophilus ruber]|uniref:Uncharacterized protein n=1 Tax=Geodermatophilus ruber TaxID=504800 RepID=A0A1I4BZG3_9ACTN|nr:hypothetical protein SAMN04488085_103259 [Geodermatophilus ruber]
MALQTLEQLAQPLLVLGQRGVVPPGAPGIEGHRVVGALADVQPAEDRIAALTHPCTPRSRSSRRGRSSTGCRQPRYEETNPNGGGHVPISGPPVPPGPVTTPPGSSTTGAISHADLVTRNPLTGGARKVTGRWPAPEVMERIRRLSQAAADERIRARLEWLMAAPAAVADELVTIRRTIQQADGVSQRLRTRRGGSAVQVVDAVGIAALHHDRRTDPEVIDEVGSLPLGRPSSHFRISASYATGRAPNSELGPNEATGCLQPQQDSITSLPSGR